MHLAALFFAGMLLAVILLFAHVATDDIILLLMTFLDDHVTALRKDDPDVLTTLLTIDGFVTFLGAVVAANRKRELDLRLTVLVRVMRTTMLGARMFLTIHFRLAIIHADNFGWVNVTFFITRVTTFHVNEAHSCLT